MHNSSLSTTKHAMTNSEQNLWQNKIYHQEPASSVDHCAAICRISYYSNNNCDIFSWDGATCHIGRNDKNSHTNNVPSGVSQIYLDSCTYFCKIRSSYLYPDSNFIAALVEDELDNFMVVENVTSQEFQRSYNKLVMLAFQHFLYYSGFSMKAMTHLLHLPLKHVSGSITGMQNWPRQYMLMIQPTNAGLEIHPHHLDPSH